MASFKKEDSIFSEIKFNFPVMLSYIFLGMLVAEIFIIIDMLVRVSFSYVTGFSKTEGGWIITFTYLAGLYLGLLNMNSYKKLNMAIKSKRFDIFIFITSGITLTWTYNGFGILLTKKWIDYISGMQISVLLILPFIMVGITYLQMHFNKKVVLKEKINGKDKESNFISDLAEEKRENDKFDLTNQSNNFAENVYNNGSKESLVFGIDAPWGSGKSTFVNFCKEYWEEKYKEKIIVYNFDVLRYEDEENLFNKFVDGLIKEIKNNMFAPELESLISKYAKILTNSKATISLGPFRFGSPLETESIDKIVDDLKNILEATNQKIIIIIDDLDRLNFSSIKEILFAIKKAFTFPNISYVLCYDTQNISILEQQFDGEKLSEFLEKFVNIKTNIFINNKLLENYFLSTKEKTLKNNLLFDNRLILKATEGLKDIFNSNEFHLYVSFLGDARKLKRLINIIIFLKVDKTDFENSDFNKQDLIHLLIIYINYPDVFRKIYNTETKGKKGFFSLGYKDNKYMISENFSNYICKESFLTENQKFLLKKIFYRDFENVISLSQNILETYACFNHSTYDASGVIISKGNLEQYLNLIVNMDKPLSTNQYKFYENQASFIIDGEKNIKNILNSNEFKREINHDRLFSIILNEFRKKIKPKKFQEIMNYLLNSLDNYSILSINEELNKFRVKIPYILIEFLNAFGWRNINENNDWEFKDVEGQIIIDFIFDKDIMNNKGILNFLGNKNRGILGLYDLLLFYSGCYKGVEKRNLMTALYNNADFKFDNNILLSQRDRDIHAIRKLSQNVFLIFKRNYINSKVNIFSEIENLSINDILGKYYNKNSVDKDNLSIKLSTLKNKLKELIISELTDKNIDNNFMSDSWCGFYDEIGKEDQNGINKSMNNYLFDICFNPELSETNYIYFLDYLMINSEKLEHNSNLNYNPNIKAFTSILDIEKIKNYWKKNKEKIKQITIHYQDRILYISKYEISYSTHIQDIYKDLDEIMDN